MLNLSRHCGLVLLALTLSACDPAPPPPPGPIAVEAGYRLLFNDALVGNALFVLQIEADGAYRIEAFTTPAGQMQQASSHEVLESSHGVIDAQGVRPLRFDHSVMADEDIELSHLVFDWDRHLLRLADGEKGERSAALLSATHDRLSYLLTARQLAMAGEGSAQIRIASTKSTDQTRLQVAGREAIDVPLGHYNAVAIRRVTPEPDVIRALWFDSAVSPLPLRVVHGWEGNTVDMQLESLSRPPSHPR